jgi:hypothetical protein
MDVLLLLRAHSYGMCLLVRCLAMGICVAIYIYTAYGYITATDLDHILFFVERDSSVTT